MEEKKLPRRFALPGRGERSGSGEGSTARRRPGARSGEVAPIGEAVRQSRTDRFAARDFSSLLGMRGLSEPMLKNHFQLYQGYVQNANKLLDEIEALHKAGRLDSPGFAELKRRFGWEYDGIRLHELYFENLTQTPVPIDSGSRLFGRLTDDFGSPENWKKEFRAMGAMRGIGWVVLYHDTLRNRLVNTWIGEHDEGHLCASPPVIVMDVFEHAYMLDYGIKKDGYLDAFFDNLHWEVVSSRIA